MRYIFFLLVYITCVCCTLMYAAMLMSQRNEEGAFVALVLGLIASFLCYLCVHAFQWQLRDPTSAAWTFLRSVKQGAIVGLVFGSVLAAAIFMIGFSEGSKEELGILALTSAACLFGATAIAGIGYGTARGLSHVFGENRSFSN